MPNHWVSRKTTQWTHVFLSHQLTTAKRHNTPDTPAQSLTDASNNLLMLLFMLHKLQLWWSTQWTNTDISVQHTITTDSCYVILNELLYSKLSSLSQTETDIFDFQKSDDA